jgi:putative membrane protein insertion efficiency factor
LQIPQRALILLVRGYRLILSPWLGSSCRFEPTCSAYAQDALRSHGAAAGSYLAAARVLRCHPWCDGGHDPVPAQPPSLFRRFATDAATSSTSSDKTSP